MGTLQRASESWSRYGVAGCMAEIGIVDEEDRSGKLDRVLGTIVVVPSEGSGRCLE